ncbi:hypothetical protein [Clostridium grantii]|uniref:Uncharacterized protein n=1 Tax=Clostridium grantii DSM 8605 TaxID=1121316 RepID=A0A1M5QGR0_9CLOT|nr:hypothetical protein [Clostridium grantii]SHH12959.1 hypothetical protein SAMN02745207_00069 [Clostridium grantii DSM 8605]
MNQVKQNNSKKYPAKTMNETSNTLRDILIFLPFGIMLGWQPGYLASLISLKTTLSVIISVVIGVLLIKTLKSFYCGQMAKNGVEACRIISNKILNKSVINMVPFIVIAFLAQFFLKWNTIMPFASTGLIAIITTASAEVTKVGIKGWKVMIIPTLIGTVFTTIWMFIVTFMTNLGM